MILLDIEDVTGRSQMGRALAASELVRTAHQHPALFLEAIRVAEQVVGPSELEQSRISLEVARQWIRRGVLYRARASAERGPRLAAMIAYKEILDKVGRQRQSALIQ